MFRKILDQGEAGDNVGLLLRGIKKDEVERGMVIAKPGSLELHNTFKASVSTPAQLGIAVFIACL